jgi:hypothetical protein
MNGLRNVVREEELPGLGQCYIYDDGSHCPKQIDGESVNPRWGLTKAGRPRKRAPPKPKAVPRNNRRSPGLDSGYGSRSSGMSLSARSSFIWDPVARGVTSSWDLGDIDTGDIPGISDELCTPLEPLELHEVTRTDAGTVDGPAEHGRDVWKVGPVSTGPTRTASSLDQISPGICPSTTPTKNPALESLVGVYNSPDGTASPSARASITSEGELSFVGSAYSDELAESWELGLDPAIRLIRAKLVDQLVSGYESGIAEHGKESQHDGDDPSSSSQQSSDTNSSSGVVTKSSATSLGKHPRATDDVPNEDNQGPVLKRKRKTAPAISLDGRLLACPYCKYDPTRYSERNQEEKDYRRCASSYLTTISRLKQHLYRVHKRPEHHCVSCFMVFVSKELLDSHTRQRPSCELRPPQFEEKMTFEQLTQIKRRAPAQDPSDTWFAIFRILFPGTALPHSPYVDSVSPEVIQDFLDYFYRQAQSRFSDLIRTELQGRMLMQGDQQRILDSALESAIAQLVSQRETSVSFTDTQSSSQDVASNFPGLADIPSQTTGANAELRHQILAETPLPTGAGHAGPQPWSEVQFNYLGNGVEVENYLNAGYFEMLPELQPEDAFDGNMYTRWCQDR